MTAVGACILIFAVLSTATESTARGDEIPVVSVAASSTHGPQRPASIPVLPGLNVGRSFFSGGAGKPASEPLYTPAEGDSFAIHNGPRTCNHILTSGAWWLLVGDRPVLRISLRSVGGVYAMPAMLPGLEVAGDTRLLVTASGRTKWLDQFDTIDAVLSPGSAKWTCRDQELSVVVHMEAQPFEEVFGFAATATVTTSRPEEVVLTWVFGTLPGNHQVTVKDNYAAVQTANASKYTQVYVGLADRGNRIGKGLLGNDQQTLVTWSDTAERPLAFLESSRKVNPSASADSRFVCVWGYSDYDHQAVDEAYQRLKYKPFADSPWVETMKQKWFHHWVGRGLNPEEKFLEVLKDSQTHVAQSSAFWNQQRSRLRIKTPDERFDNAINNTAAALRRQYEYPAFVHGLEWLKYGKISCGHFGCEATGYHQEVADSLKFISGTQDLRGRQRYFEPVFSISSWSEEQNFYYVCHVWHHYCWTGDREFLEQMWPSVLRAMEHGLLSCDPDGDGVMTGYYEQWNCDGHGRGGKSAIFTGMAQAALMATEQMAQILGGRFMEQITSTIQQFPRNPEYAQHYAMLRARTQQKLKEELWNKELGAYCSAEWNGDMRPRPEAMEQSWFIWRGVGEPMDNYMAMRYVRENLHLHTAPGVTMELMNDWWPITWSHHYVANGDTAYSIASACKSGDVDGFWPALKSITETAYRSDTATLYHGMANDGTGRGMNQLIELEPMVMLAVVEGVFGAEPAFGENLLVLRPNLPSHWDHAEIATTDFSYSFRKTAGQVTLTATLPVARRVRAELPVKAAVLGVTLNGQPMPYSQESAVNCCRVLIDAPAGKTHHFEITLAEPASVAGATRVVAGREAKFTAQNATIHEIHDPQQKLRQATIAGNHDQAVFVPDQAGKWTVFLELQAGSSRWLQPLDLQVQSPWSIVERAIAARNSGGPSIASPHINPESKTLSLQIENHTQDTIDGPGTVTICGVAKHVPLNIPPQQSFAAEIPLADIWDRLSPGSVAIAVEWAGEKIASTAVSWTLPPGQPSRLAGRLRKLDLQPHYNVDISHLYSQQFKWRHDYTGCGIGIDWRDPQPLKDRLGYYLPATPVDQFEYQTLPEGFCGTARFEPPTFSGMLETPCGVSFRVGSHPLAAETKGNLLALASTEPYEQLPSEVRLTIPQPERLDKVYLLTANLTKTSKCYYPGAEVILRYQEGPEQIVSLVPPHTMSCFGQHFCPRALAIAFGTIHGDCGPLRMGGMEPHLAVTDILPDPARKVAEIRLRCVASETVFGVLGITLLLAP